MRTENQIKRKLNELTVQLKSAEAQLKLAEPEVEKGAQADPGNETRAHMLRARAEQLESMVTLLEWVLNEPTGSYHT
ncbi:hypothetical protein [Paenibacillus agricola]|uniref:Uncharacterized protein n=1 Tax=Paenibacillus agricola TaxID=2716264 RepID=A0ABX0J2T1_9BACL|nr:hypothetical protein [Paenibacillus agricola]NHN30635.1 hypothetical protein [Paenibacillus agricola]